MEDVSAIMNRLISKVPVVKGECPYCQEPLYAWQNKKPNGEERCAPTCMNCGYYDLKRKNDVQTNEIYTNSLKSRALNTFKNGSIVPDKTQFDKNMDNFNVVDNETQEAKRLAEEFVQAVLKDDPKHFIMSGKSGVGKSHIAMATCWEILEQSNYDKKCLFINYRELLEQLKFSFNDEQARREIQGSLMADIKTIDVLVVDDLGSELGGTQAKNSTTYNNDVIYSILEARQNQATIITTNLDSKEIKAAYGDRIVSRMLNNSDGFVQAFKNAKDRRINNIA